MKKSFKLITALALAALPQPNTVRAGSHTWSGANSIYFNNPSNWSYGGAPVAGEQNVSLYFPSGATRYTCSNNISGLTVSSINFSGNNYAISGNPINLTTNITTSGDLNGIAAPLLLTSSNITVNVSAGVTLYLNGAISGTGDLTKIGLGTLQYNWTDYNTYTGTTYVNSGMLLLTRGVSGAAIVGPLVVGTPTGSPGTAVAKLLFGSQIAASSIETVNFTGILQLTSDPDWIAGLVMGGGTVETGTGLLGLLGDVTVQNGASTIN